VAQDQLAPEGRQVVALSSAGQSEGQDVFGAFNKAAFQQRGQQSSNFLSQELFIEVAQGFALGKT
tara:strand:- start:769 stop:963 length:195 start_codon:yes stop_codon:yes gene_type:complete